MTNSEIVASFIVRILPERKDKVEPLLSTVEFVEIHSYDAGKFIITISDTDENTLFQQFTVIKQLAGVLSVELVFCGFSEDGPGRDMVKEDIPEWLNSDIDAKKIPYNGGIPKSIL